MLPQPNITSRSVAEDYEPSFQVHMVWDDWYDEDADNVEVRTKSGPVIVLGAADVVGLG